MNKSQLKNWLTGQLKLAEPLDCPSEMDDPQGVAVEASKRMTLIGLTSADLLEKAYKVETPQECAVVLAGCLNVLNEPEPEPNNQTVNSVAMSVVQAAEYLGVSKELIYAICGDGRLIHTRIGRLIIIKQEHLDHYREGQQSDQVLRHLV